MKLKDENYKKNCGSIMGLCFSLNFKNKFQVGMVNFFFFFLVVPPELRRDFPPVSSLSMDIFTANQTHSQYADLTPVTILGL